MKVANCHALKRFHLFESFRLAVSLCCLAPSAFDSVLASARSPDTRKPAAAACVSLEGAPSVSWRAEIVSPSPRFDFGMAYDIARQRIVLYGGNTTRYTDGNDTWEYDGTAWRLTVEPNPWLEEGPGKLSEIPMVYDSDRRRVVLYRDKDYYNIPRGDTWEYDGANWTKIAVSDPEGDGNPPTEGAQVSCYDSSRSRTILVCYEAPGGAENVVVWEYDGVSWRRVVTADPEGDGDPEGGGCLAYDSRRQRAVGQYYGGITSSAVGQVRRFIRAERAAGVGTSRLTAVEELARKLRRTQ